jgi:hypothetical protein
MSLWYLPPLGGAHEANPLTSQVDSQLNFPLGCCDSAGAPTLPSPGQCRGHLRLLDAEEGKPQVTWESGQDAYFQLSDHAYTINAPGSTHYGGSCQVGFSTDKGRTWRVAASCHGNCPHRHEDGLQTFYFRVPMNMPKGPAVFAWIWLNREHESFMNCASVQIGEGLSNVTQPKVAYSSAIQSTSQTTSTNRRNHVMPNSTSRHHQIIASPTGSHRERTRHKHRRKHYKYSYYVRAVDKPKSLPKSEILLEERAYQACDWTSAPMMRTSYYTKDAKCAANAKMELMGSDDFEIGWSDACGVIKGDREYTIKDLKCK